MSVADSGSGTSGGSPSIVGCGREQPTPRIIALVPDTSSATISSSTRCVTKVDDAPLLLRALTEPDDAGAWNQLQWNGGAPADGLTANYRAVARTQAADDVRVIVTLGSGNAHQQIAITAVLTRIDHVDGAVFNRNDNEWHADYHDTGAVVVLGVTNPDNAAARKLVAWEGDGQVLADYPGHYAIPRTTLGEIVVVAGLGSNEEEFAVVIDPILTGLTVGSPAVESNGAWFAPYSESASDFVIVTASTKPSTSEALKRIRWEGGEEGSDNTRRVRQRRVGPVNISASLPTTEIRATVVILPRLIRLDVVNAVNTGGTNWNANFSATLTDVVLLTAVTAPDSADVHRDLVWTNGSPVSGHPEQRAVPRSALGATTVTVALFADSLSAQITIDPVLVSLGVAHAADHGGGNFTAPYSATATDVVALTAVTAPNTAEVHALLAWTNGDAVIGHDDQHTVSRGVLGATTVTVALGAVSFFAQIRIEPVLVSLGVAHAADQGGGNWTAPYSATATDVVELTAVTAPNTAEVHALLGWTNGDAVAGHDNQHTVSRGALAQTDVSVGLGGVTLTQSIFVRPILADLAVQAPAVVTAGRAYKALTDAAGLVAVATTVPDTPAAWACIGWNAGMAGVTLNLRTYGRGASGTVTITATIDATALTATVDVRTPPVLRLDAMACVNHRPVALDTGLGSVASPEWTRTMVTRSPVCYTAGTKLNVSLTVAVTTAGSQDLPVLFRGRITVAGTATTFEHTKTVLTTDGSVTVDVEADVALPAGVHHADNAQIVWEVEIDGAPAAALATTAFDLYVMLRASTGTVVDFHTLVHVSCAAADTQTVDANVFDAIWTAFTPLAMSRASDHAGLTYWVPNNTDASSTALLLARVDGGGQCGAWAEMLRDMCEVHGIASVEKIFVVAGRRWDAWMAGKECKILFDINPAAAGQRNPTPPGAFYNHFIVRETTSGRYYDPSYGGVSYLGVADWKAASLTGAQKVPANDEACLLTLNPPFAGPGTVLYLATPVDVTVLNTCRLDYNTGSPTAVLGAPYPKGGDENVILPAATMIGRNVTADGVYRVRAGDSYTFPAPMLLTGNLTGTVPPGATVTLPLGVTHLLPANLLLSLGGDQDFPNGYTFACDAVSPQLTLPTGTTLHFPAVTYIATGNVNLGLSNGSTVDAGTAPGDNVYAVTAGQTVTVTGATVVTTAPWTCVLPPGTGVEAPASGPVRLPANTGFRLTSGSANLPGPGVVTYPAGAMNLTVQTNATLNYPATPAFTTAYDVILPAGAHIWRSTAVDGVATVYAGETILGYTTTSITLGADETGRLPAETLMTVPGGVTAAVPATSHCKLSADLPMPDDEIVFFDCATGTLRDRA